MSAIKVENISKCFGKVKALDHVSFEVERGELFGLIGPDGAGKTTLFRLLLHCLIPMRDGLRSMAMILSKIITPFVSVWDICLGVSRYIKT